MIPQEIEQYVLLASDASDIQLQQQASHHLNQWVSLHNDMTLADTITDLIRFTTKEVVLFYALTVFTRLDNATPQQRALFRNELLSQLLYTSTSKNQNTYHSNSINNYHQSTWSPTYLRTKVGVLLAHFIQLDFPHSWSTAFEEIQSTQIIQYAPDILLRTLMALMEDFGKNESDTNSIIKDYMRGYSPNQNGQQQEQQTINPSPQQTITGQLIQTIVSLLEQPLTRQWDNGRHEEQLQIITLCLTVLKEFMSWVDLTLLLEDKVMQLIYVALAKGSTTNSDLADAAVVAIGCMEELLAHRGMEDKKKISLLQHTTILEKIHTHVDLVTADASPIDVVMEVAKFINRTGLEVLPILEQEQIPEDSNLKAQLLELFFRCFAYDDIDVSGAVIPFAGSIISILVDQQKNGDQTLLSRLLTITYTQMKYPPDFRYDFEDDDEAEEEVYRTELQKLNQKLVRANPELCLHFLCEVLSQLPLPLSSAPTPDVEAAIQLVYRYCEGVRPPPGMKVVMRNETFRNLLIGLHKSDITQHQHQQILTLYYETSVRYYPLLKERPDLLQKLLQELTGVRGMQHDNLQVRSRCCYLLLRLVKSVGTNNSSSPDCVLRPYVESAVSGIQNLLQFSNLQLRQEDILNLFETIGLLVGKTGLSPSEQQEYLTRVMTPHVRSIEETLSGSGDASLKDSDIVAEKLSGSVAAIAYLSKGFKKPPPEVQAVLLETMKVALSVLEVLSPSEQVRNKTFVLLQRLIQCLDGMVLPFLPRFLFLLTSHCTAEDMLDVAQLMNQICIKFKANAVDAIDANLLLFLQKCHNLSNAITTSNDNPQEDLECMDAPHRHIEQLSIQKLSYTVLQHVVVHGATTVLFSPTNASSLEAILQSLCEGAIHVEDPVVKKSCLVFFKELSDQWVLDPDGKKKDRSSLTLPDYIRIGFLRFLCDTFIPQMFKLYLSDNTNVDIDDANHCRCLAEFSCILAILKNRLPEAYGREIIAGKLNGLSQPITDGLRTANCQKEFEACLKTMIRQSH